MAENIMLTVDGGPDYSVSCCLNLAALAFRLALLSYTLLVAYSMHPIR